MRLKVKIPSFPPDMASLSRERCLEESGEELSRFPLALTFQIENTSFTLGLAPPHVFYHFPLCFPEMKIPSPHPRTSEIPFIVHCLQCLIVNNVTSPHYLLVLLKNRHRADPRPTSFLLAYQEVLSLQTKLVCKTTEQ